MISVCLATFNGEAFINIQIQSILKQIGSDDELIISDNGSTDKTIQIIKGIGDDRIKIVAGPHELSPIANFQNALQAAKGEYIFLSDQDDVWLDNKVETCMHYLETSACVISDNIVVDANLNKLSSSFYDVNKTKQGKIYNLFLRNGYLGCCMAFHRKVLRYVLPFPQDIPMHDIWIGNVAAFYFDVRFIPEKLILFRRHTHNASPTASKSTFSVKDMLRFRYQVFKNIALLIIKNR